jgi:N-acetylneuraminic acid mutarotase
MNLKQSFFQIWRLCLVMLAMLVTIFQAAGQTSFVIANPLNIPRAQHSAILLPDGEVLVAGGLGTNGTQAISSVELYNPVTGMWTVTNSMNNARIYPAATLLPNGKVLVSGGVDGEETENPIPTAELFDPTIGTWTFTGSPNITRSGQTATLLTNGMVLIAGGIGTGIYGSGSVLDSAELYNPATGMWTLTGSLHTGRENHTATLLPNGKVLVAGGYGGSELSSAELYDPTTGTWANTGSLNTGREVHTATLLPNGKVLIAGGDGSSTLSSAELYDPTTGTWANTGSLNTGRGGHTATLRPNGQVLVAGGYNYSDSSTFASAELYDPITGVWTYTGSMNVARAEHTATLLPTGKVLMTGGILFVSRTPILSSTEQYDAPLGYLRIFGQLLSTGDMQLSFTGIADANYALDRSPSLAPANWTPQATNQTDLNGVLMFTNIPDVTTNNFWRIRSVP